MIEQCFSGEPMTLEEMTRKERERQEKKLRKQLDKQQKVNIDYYRGLRIIITGQTAEDEYIIL